MKARELAVVVCLILGGTMPGGAQDAPPAQASPLQTLEDRFSYSLGMNLGKQLKQNNVELNYDVYLRALKDAQDGNELLLSDEDAAAVMREFQTVLRQRQLEKGKLEGQAFLEANKAKENIVATPSGLQYRIVTKGTGPVPTTNDTVVTHYRGTLIDGTEFDNSYSRGEPATFAVTGVIKGWTEALLLMPVGSKWQLFVPGEIAYGERGTRNIPPNSTLLFDIELLEIKKPDPKPAASPPASPQ